ncbi:VWA domain-containing protein [Ferrimonas sediminicola]|uniref:VWA domain-containing protein n=1 Tax=Ferrimonas sediminicola TaxID=2569538 RepID=A0A4U1BC12_9GAMM|nr:VWA domain-containing protein [Ferrimonas sediminicola]TKB48170.1 VWA domain-containing protein [Ferrimonas sediminicola]
MFELGHPWALLLLPLPLLVQYCCRPFEIREESLRFPLFDELACLHRGLGGVARVVPGQASVQQVVVVTGWVALCLSLAKPLWLAPPVALPVAAREIMVAIDLSRSMNETDFVEGERTMDRVQGVKEMMARFAQARRDDRLGLILFADQPFLQTPFTDSLDAWLQLLMSSEQGMAGSMTAIGDAIGLAVHAFQQARTGNRVLVLITDGKDNASMVPPLEAAQLAARHRIRIHTIAIGDPGSGDQNQPDFRQLAEIASITGGRDFRAADRNQLLAINAELNRLEPSLRGRRVHRPKHSLHHWPLSLWLAVSLPLMGLSGWRQRGRADG